VIQFDLTGRTALVTGGGQGLGRATATLLHAAGASVAINYFPDAEGHNEQLANEAVAALSQSDRGGRAFAVPADVCDREAVARMIGTIRERTGRLDIVVNNAAIIRDRTIRKMTDDEWDQVLATNLTGVFNVCRAAAGVLERGGRIVNMASISGVLGFFGQANYSSAKAGVIALTKVLSKELAAKEITVNAVAPGVVLTEMGKTIPDEVREEMLRNIPLKRFGEPDDIARAILFLASDWAGYITGQTLHVNGGWYA
jgi:3-oxoacyl-[acyl-carrier protein] reductase